MGHVAGKTVAWVSGGQIAPLGFVSIVTGHLKRLLRENPNRVSRDRPRKKGGGVKKEAW